MLTERYLLKLEEGTLGRIDAVCGNRAGFIRDAIEGYLVAIEESGDTPYIPEKVYTRKGVSYRDIPDSPVNNPSSKSEGPEAPRRDPRVRPTVERYGGSVLRDHLRRPTVVRVVARDLGWNEVRVERAAAEAGLRVEGGVVHPSACLDA